MVKWAFSHDRNGGIIPPADGNFRLIVEWRTGGVPLTKNTKTKAQKKAEEDANLDEALAETFPASDPLSMIQPRTGADVPQRRPGDIRSEKCRPGRSQTIGNEVVRCEPILLFEFAPASRGDQQPSDGTRCPKPLVAVAYFAQSRERSRDEFHHRVLSH